MKKIVKLTESDLNRIVRNILKESDHDIDEHITWDIRATDCEYSGRIGYISSMGVDYDEDDNPVVMISYCKGQEDELEYLKEKARKEIIATNQLPKDDHFYNPRKR
jgi:hypothetical protein